MLDWTCISCGRPVADGTGVVTFSRTAADAAGDERETDAMYSSAGMSRGQSLGDLLEGPDLAPWYAAHDECLPSDASYTISVERLRTPDNVLEWTAHLLEKIWFPDTDWAEVIQRVRGNARYPS